MGGGCFQNARLLSTLRSGLRDDGFEVLVARRLGPNDGAISVGQAAIGAALLAGLDAVAAPPREITVPSGG
jgi:hydrogenase maturation protein HypF